MPDARELYLDLLKKCLTYSLWEEDYRPIDPTLPRAWPRNWLIKSLVSLLGKFDSALVKKLVLDPAQRANGQHWPLQADTMIGFQRLNNLQFCVEDVLRRNVPGDLIETGVWRGGATIFMRAILQAYQVTDRTVWVADSFNGLPEPDPEKYPADVGDIHYQFTQLKVSQAQVAANFAKYGLLDEQVQFLQGWFKDTLPGAPFQQLAVMRLDGDMYESTMDALEALYPKLSPGGYVIIDDYVLKNCQAAVHDFRAAHQITDEIKTIDWAGVYWQRTAAQGQAGGGA